MQAICTIIAKNYLAQARVLCASFIEQHPDGKCFVLLIDESEGYFDPAAETFTLIRLEDLPLARGLVEMCFQYGVTELATAVKASFLRHLFANYELEAILYLDPDILVTGSLDALFSALVTHDAVLTPHLDSEFPNDGKGPDTSSILLTGAYNLGFLGIRNSAQGNRLLLWLEAQTAVNCIVNRNEGYFYDQKFFDVAVTLFEGIHIERSVGYNMAPWNLHSRTLSREDGRWRCNGRKLNFFHFSNFKPSRPAVISGLASRYTFSDRPDLAPIYAEYTSALVQQGVEQCAKWPYTHNRLHSGELICPQMREQYRTSAKLRGEVGNPFKSIKVRRLNSLLSALDAVARSVRPRQRSARLFKRVLG